TTQILRAVWGTSASDVWAVGNLRTIIHYDGSSWSTVRSETTDILMDVWGSSSSNLWSVGTTGTILHAAPGP
ncbi:MAG: hypothetical protein DMD63_15490, partial [Gemmatimonadetes bacterium]